MIERLFVGCLAGGAISLAVAFVLLAIRVWTDQ